MFDEFQETVARQQYDRSVDRLLIAFLGLIPDTTRAGREQLVAKLSDWLANLSDRDPQAELPLPGGEVRS